MVSCCHLERWLSGRKRQIANLLRVLSPFGGSNPPLSVLFNLLGAESCDALCIAMLPHFRLAVYLQNWDFLII